MSENRVEEVRKRLLLSMRSLAGKAGLSDGVIARVESGKHSSLYVKLRILKALGLSRGNLHVVFPDEQPPSNVA